jgi:8-oxo-dGTP pyrophosphatase MutT (NUDIX family)
MSAGGVVYRRGAHGVEVALCGRRQPKLWALPKGTPNAGETVEQTALREVREETGLDVLLERKVQSIAYWFVRAVDGVRCHKTVHFFLMRAVGGSVDRHDPEFDDVQWFPADEALRMLTHANEAKVVEEALAMVQAESGSGRENSAR